MTHEEARAWLIARNLFARVTPVEEPGMWHLRTEAKGYMEFVTAELEKSLSGKWPQPHLEMY